MAEVPTLLEQFKNALSKALQEKPAKANSQILKDHQLNRAPVTECHRKHTNHTDSHIDRIEKPLYPTKTPTKG